MMFDRRRRLTKRGSLHRTLRAGHTFHAPPLTLKYFIRRDQGEQQFTVVVSTKVSKRATVRNRLKRQLRALLRAHTDALPKHADYLLILRPHTPLATWKELSRSVATLRHHFARTHHSKP